MIKTFTRNDLIRFLYKETTSQEEKEIKRALLMNSRLLDEFRDLKKLIRNIDDLQVSPSEEVIDKIINYSKTLNLHSVK